MRDYDISNAMQEKLRAASMDASQTNCATAQQQCGSLGMGEPRRESFGERLRARGRAAERESRKANEISELVYLLEKNPDIARILDLIESAGQ